MQGGETSTLFYPGTTKSNQVIGPSAGNIFSLSLDSRLKHAISVAEMLNLYLNAPDTCS